MIDDIDYEIDEIKGMIKRLKNIQMNELEDEHSRELKLSINRLEEAQYWLTKLGEKEK